MLRSTIVPLLQRRLQIARWSQELLRFEPVRKLHSSGVLRHGYPASAVDPATAVKVIFVERDGSERPVMAPPGKSLLEIAHANDIDLEGACDGSLACSTCHIYLDEKTFSALDEPSDEENDMLDLAFGLSELYVLFFISSFHHRYTWMSTRIRSPTTLNSNKIFLSSFSFLSIALTRFSSRLGCQIKASKDLEGMRVTLPPATRNMAVDGYIPQPH